MRLADHLPSLEFRATTTYQNSYLSLIAKHISKANNEKAPIELFANKVLKYFIPGLLILAGVSALIIGPIFGPALAIQCVISVLVSACPCALSLITPMAVKIGMKRAADEGVHFNNGKALQAAADIDTVVFDVNGTLTSGKLTVKSLLISDPKYLRHIALLESKSLHPAGKIIRAHIQEKGIMYEKKNSKMTDVDLTHHAGIKANIDGEEFMIGNQEMLLANGVLAINSPYHDAKNGSTYIVRNKQVIGQINLTDPLRPDAIATVKKLKELGKTIHLCTGADRATAEEYAKMLGIDKQNISANTVGVISRDGEISKTSYIQGLRKKGHKVAMVGDAANDVAAIADSDLGIAVKSSIGDAITEQHAGMVIQQGHLLPIATAFDVSKKTKQNIFQNLFISLSFNSVVTLVAAGAFVAIGFALNPAVGVALMILESTIVLANLFRLKHQAVLSSKTSPEAQLESKPKQSTTNLLNVMNFSPQPEVEATNTTTTNPSPAPKLFSVPKDLKKPSYQEPKEAERLACC